jgi:hypothetical protein
MAEPTIEVSTKAGVHLMTGVWDDCVQHLMQRCDDGHYVIWTDGLDIRVERKEGELNCTRIVAGHGVVHSLGIGKTLILLE